MTHSDKPLDDPLIGLLSTRDLLIELKERGITEPYHFDKGAWLANAAEAILNSLPKEMLDFRNVEKVSQEIPPIPDGVEGIQVGSHIRVLARANSYTGRDAVYEHATDKGGVNPQPFRKPPYKSL